MHARVAFFKLKSGSLDEVVERVRSDEGLLTIFKQQPGFQSYELIETGSGLISVSHWESQRQADEADRAGAEWAAEHIDELVKLRQSDTGRVALAS